MQPGTQLAHYEILSELGKGGMGEVWKARDTKLGREVAIKTLPEEFAQDSDRVARFEREAKLLASLNHPNIAAIYGLEEHEGTRFIVLELVPGDTLADRLIEGAITLKESLELGFQIAQGVEAAHENNVIHRDLKPANIKVTPDGKVKVLDFGLAKMFGGIQNQSDLSNSPTLSVTATQQGAILGTAFYMSPEQARGHEVDRRTDVWSLGCVLFEMLTGRKTFDGDTVSDVIAGVLGREPQWELLPAGLHPRIRLLLERCLERNLKNRYHGIADARFDIEKVLSDPQGVFVQSEPLPQMTRRSVLRLGGVAVGAGAAASVATWYLKPSNPVSPYSFPYDLPEGQQLQNFNRSLVAISPDGRHFVYNGVDGLYLRSMADELDAVLIAGTEGNVTNPFFSPDNRWVGYFSADEGKLNKVEIAGGQPVELCDATNPFGASWESDRVVYGQTDGIWQVSSNGGTPRPLIQTEPPEQVHGPQILPNGEWVLFTLATGTDANRWNEAQVVAQPLTSDDPSDRRVLVQNGSDARFVPTGHLVYALGEALWAVPFDPQTLQVIGGEATVVEGIARAANLASNTGTANYCFSENGTLVYMDGGLVSADRVLGMVDRNGQINRLELPPDRYARPRLSPDGTRLAVELDQGGTSHIWIYDVDGEAQLQPLTIEGHNTHPVWTSDSQRVTFSSNGIIHWKAISGGDAEPLTTSNGPIAGVPDSWSPEDAFLLYTRGGIGIWTYDRERQTSQQLIDEPDSTDAQFSPNGRWVAHERDEVYVEPFPTGTQPFPVSRGGGDDPIWSPDGNELFFRRGSEFYAAQVQTTPSFRVISTPRLPVSVIPVARQYSVDPNGESFLMAFTSDQLDSGRSGRARIIVVLNWFERLKERVPVQ